MRVLVTGATGFIGRRLCRALLDAGHAVTAVSRNAARARPLLPGVEHVFEWDPSGAPAPAVFDGVEGVVHLAGESVAGLWTEAKKRAIHDSRVHSTRHLVSSLEGLQSRPGVLVSASAVGYYGDRGDEVLDEDSTPSSDYLAQVCQRWEEEAARARHVGLRVVSLRIGLVMGKGGGMLESLLPAARLGLVGRLGSGEQWWSWIHIDDVVRLVIFALENEVSGPLNATAPAPVRQIEWSRTLQRVLSRRAWVRVPEAIMKLAGEFSMEILSSKRVVPKRATAAGFTFSHPHLEPALRGLLTDGAVSRDDARKKGGE